jgi:hypothetical protein
MLPNLFVTSLYIVRYKKRYKDSFPFFDEPKFPNPSAIKMRKEKGQGTGFS